MAEPLLHLNKPVSYTHLQQTLDYLQSLYEKRLCTYPRTDSRYLTDGMEEGVKSLVLCAAGICGLEPPFAVYAEQVCDSSKVTDLSLIHICKWGGVPTGITQNVKDLLASPEIENILENSDYICMLNQASGDRQILAQKLNISPHQLSYVTQANEGEGLLFYGNVIVPFVDRFPKDTEMYKLMTTKPNEIQGGNAA